MEEVDVLAVSAVLNALRFAAKLVYGMLLHESGKIIMEGCNLFLVGLNGRGNGLDELTSELLSEGINLLGSSHSIVHLLVYLTLRGSLKLEGASALSDTVHVCETKGLGVKALNSTILVALGIDLSV